MPTHPSSLQTMNHPSLSFFAVALVSASISVFSPLTIVDAFATFPIATMPAMPAKCTSTIALSTTSAPIPGTSHTSMSNAILCHRISSNDVFEQSPTGNKSNSPSPGNSNTRNSHQQRSHRILDKRRKHWINRSLKYYTTVAREQKRRSRGQLPPSFPRTSPNEFQTQIRQAERHYFARNLIKSGKLDQAEALYRRIIDEIQNDEDGCDHARLAVSTLLLALLKQRMNDVKGARSVFLNFFRTIMEYPEDKECACSAKVLQAYALFEMKRGHGRKSLVIVERAVELDEELRPVLAWKQFREVVAGQAS